MLYRCLLVSLLQAGMVLGYGPFSTSELERGHGPISPKTAVIAGHVLNNNGQAISAATVYAESSSITLGKLPIATSDDQGSFLIELPAAGTYKVYASKEAEGYADTGSLFHSAGFLSIPEVKVSQGEKVQGIVVQMGPKAARIDGQIMDVRTKHTMKNAQITLSRIESQNYTYSTGTDVNGSFNVLVPSAAFKMKVSAPGYDDWFYKSEDGQDDFIQLSSDTTKRIIVILQPKN